MDNTPPPSPPPRYKRALLTWLGLLAPVHFIPPALAAVLPADVSGFGVVAIAVALIVMVMMYGISPLLDRLFASWLFPEPRSALRNVPADSVDSALA